jgi:hypothetical protein
VIRRHRRIVLEGGDEFDRDTRLLLASSARSDLNVDIHVEGIEKTLQPLLAEARELTRHAVSWLVIAGEGPWLLAGIYPSTIAQVVRPIVSMPLTYVRRLIRRYAAAPIPIASPATVATL